MADADDDWGEFAGDENPVSPALYSKGSAILYQTRDGDWIPGKVTSVDISIVPPSYCVEVDGNLRETEEWRLKHPSAAPVAAAFVDSFSREPEEFNFTSLNIDSKDENLDEDDFGDFSAAPELPPPLQQQLPPSSPRVTSVHSSPTRSSITTPPATSPKLGSPQSAGGGSTSSGGGGGDHSIEKSFRKFLSVAAPNVAHVLEEQDALEETINDISNSAADGFGDFADAPTTVPVEVEEKIENIKDATTTEKVADVGATAATEAPSSPFLRNLGASFASHSTSHYSNGAQIAPPSPHITASVQEYGVAWTSLLTVAAEKLEQGRLFWTNLAEYKDQNNAKTTESLGTRLQVELLEIPRVQVYFTALGKVYYVASLVRLAAEMQGLLHLVQELESAWARCCHAWTSTTRAHSTTPINSSTIDSHVNAEYSTNGASHIHNSSTDFEIKPLSWVSIEAAKKRGLDELISTEIAQVDVVARILPSLSLDEFPRMLAWSEGLDSMLLLPLSVIIDSSSLKGGKEIGGEDSREEKTMAAVVEWPEGSGRLCLSAVTNFWLGCVSSIPPELE